VAQAMVHIRPARTGKGTSIARRGTLTIGSMWIDTDSWNQSGLDREKRIIAPGVRNECRERLITER
jgi:hypothetical protein